jgi:renal tumor antigen
MIYLNIDIGLNKEKEKKSSFPTIISCLLLQLYFLFIKGMDQYKLEYEKGSGTFSVVFTALSLKTGKYVAIKCMKKKFDSLEKVKKLK